MFRDRPLLRIERRSDRFSYPVWQVFPESGLVPEDDGLGCLGAERLHALMKVFLTVRL